MKKKDREAIFNKYGGKCAYCGSVLDDKWQVDHMVSKCYFDIIKHIHSLPIASVNSIDNLQPACAICNHYKRDKPILSYNNIIGFRDYMLKFHMRLKKLPKHTDVLATLRRKEYMNTIANKYGIEINKPFTGIFYFEQTKSEIEKI